jgi:hypothetical protein
MNDVVTLGIDLAKNVFAVHGVDATGRVVLSLGVASRRQGSPKHRARAINSCVRSRDDGRT